jgi:hypothetical protein
MLGISALPEKISEEVGGNCQPWLKGFPVLRLLLLMRDAGLRTSTTPLHGTRQHIFGWLELRRRVIGTRRRNANSTRLQRLLFRRLWGDVGKHPLEYFASDFVGIFLRLAYFVFSGRFSLGRFHFLRNHRSTIRIYERSKP